LEFYRSVGMQSVLNILEKRISKVMCKVGYHVGYPTVVCGQKICAALVKSATDPQFGDYQVNGVMALAKELKTNPKKLAERVVEKLNVSDICEEPEVAGPGFINLRLKPEFVATNLLEINKDADRLGIDKAGKPKTIVVDFSGPNIAKQMHVGHLRSTIIGDCICRILEFLDHKVIRQNHIGDWGLQMGMVIMGLVESGDIRVFEKAGHYIWEGRHIDLETLENLYKDTTQRCEENSETARKAREWTVRLQSGDPYAKAYWQSAWVITLKACFRLYDRLGIELGAKDTSGESYYKDILPDIVAELKKKGLATESDGAVCVFPAGFKDKEGKALPVIVQKSDGAYLYATTDLAAIRYRVNELKTDEIIYVTDARQSLHFQMVFKVAEMAGWAKQEMLHHVTFGSVLGENGKPLKTREGENVKLKDLLDEAVKRAKLIVEEKNPDLPSDKKEQIARAVGIGAVKYADYSNNRTSDYIFSFDKMLAMDGNTAPYMQYAYARIKSIERKAQTRQVSIETELAGVKKLSLSELAELDLAKHLIRYGEAIEAAAADYRPNYLTSYLYELAQKFSVFYTNCPVLDAGPDKRPTRLLLCDLTAKTIGHGLSKLLGIEVVEQM
jgi:arginyl-tRNA synthetase